MAKSAIFILSLTLLPAAFFQITAQAEPKAPFDSALRQAQDSAQGKKELTLSEAIEIALKNNPNIDSMVKAIEQSQYLYLAAAKEWLPTLETKYSFLGFSKKPKLEFEIGEIEGVVLSGEKVSFPVSERTSFLWSTHVKMPIYTGGALQYQEAAAKLGINISGVRLQEAKADLIQEVTINYLNVLRLQNYLEVVTQNAARLKTHEDTTRKYFKAGLLPKNSLLEVQAKRANANQDLIVTEKDLKLAGAGLNVSMGTDVHSDYCLKGVPRGAPEAQDITYSIEECNDLAKKNNPSLVAFAYLKKRAEYVIELEKTQSRPKVFADLSFTRHGKTAQVKGDDFLSNNITAAMVVAEWNVFDWFKTRDLTQAKIKDVEMLLNNHKFVEYRVSLDILEAHLSMHAAKNKFEAAGQEIDYAKENYRISKLRYDEGVARATEVNDALMLFEQAEFNYYDALYQQNISKAKLERVIGTNIE